nr:DUF697 domain-containing protein [Aeromonas caviae]
MIEDIADVYAIELGYWSRIRLIRQVFRNMLYAGATATRPEASSQAPPQKGEAAN